MGLKSNVTGVLIRRGRFRYLHRGKCHMKRQTEIGGVHCKPRHDRDFWKPLKVRIGKEAFFLRAFRENTSNDTLFLDFQLPELWENKFLMF